MIDHLGKPEPLACSELAENTTAGLILLFVTRDDRLVNEAINPSHESMSGKKEAMFHRQDSLRRVRASWAIGSLSIFGVVATRARLSPARMHFYPVGKRILQATAVPLRNRACRVSMLHSTIIAMSDEVHAVVSHGGSRPTLPPDAHLVSLSTITALIQVKSR
jgi:hypothetical protein